MKIIPSSLITKSWSVRVVSAQMGVAIFVVQGTTWGAFIVINGDTLPLMTWYIIICCVNMILKRKKQQQKRGDVVVNGRECSG
jgi:hypothetical protein